MKTCRGNIELLVASDLAPLSLQLFKRLGKSYRSEILLGCMDPWWGLVIQFLRSGGTSYPTYLDPLVPLFGIFSLWRPVTPVKIYCHVRKLDKLFAWMSSIDWYLNWPYATFISWDMVHWLVICHVNMIGCFDFWNFFLLFGKKTPKKLDLSALDLQNSKNNRVQPVFSQNYAQNRNNIIIFSLAVQLWTRPGRECSLGGRPGPLLAHVARSLQQTPAREQVRRLLSVPSFENISAALAAEEEEEQPSPQIKVNMNIGASSFVILFFFFLF